MAKECTWCTRDTQLTCPECDGTGLIKEATDLPKWCEYCGKIHQMPGCPELKGKVADLSNPTESENQQNDSPQPFIDTPLLKAKRKAFDNPTQANLQKLIKQAAIKELKKAYDKREMVIYSPHVSVMMIKANDIKARIKELKSVIQS